MPDTPTPTCANCRFSRTDTSNLLSCRRFPPSTSQDWWPAVPAEAWCGEHSPLPKEPST